MNVLNGYRSFNYNFTLAALKRSQVNDPTTFDPFNPTLVIATTKGKSRNGIQFGNNTQSPGSTKNNSSKNTPSTQAQEDDLVVKGGVTNNVVSNQTNQDNQSNAESARIERQNNQTPGQFTSDQVDEFNKTSAGRFDMFIDDVDVKSIFTIGAGQTFSTPFEMHFTVTEPYSMNGFIEALQVSALAAGFPDYIGAAYVLIMDFIGYPDGPGTPPPTIIPNSTRVFNIRISGMEVSVSEKGTEYKLSAVPYEDRVFSGPIAETKRKLNGSGNTVAELLGNIVEGINNQIKEDAAAVGKPSKLTDTYKILFPEYDVASGKIVGNNNKIASATFDSPGVHPTNASMDKINASPNAYHATPISKYTTVNSGVPSTAVQKHTSQFDSGVPIPEIISAVIRDSSYLGDIVKAFHAGGNPDKVVDSNQMVDYFIIIPYVTDLPGAVNVETNRPYCEYTYIVQPYKMIYNTVVPGTARQILDDKNLRQNCLRQYNYFYTGKNVDILDFKINFNTLFFEALPKAMGNSKEPSSADSAGRNNSANTLKKQTTPELSGTNSIGRPAQYYTDDASSNNPGGGINASPAGAESWKQIVKVMHEAINNSVGLITGEVTILGDPYFLTAGGSGRYIIKNNTVGAEAGFGEAAKSAGEVLISIDFQNPMDIGSDGFMTFDNNTVAYSGVYQIIDVRSEFKSGLFKQTLNVIRKPGQPQNSNQTKSNLKEQFGSAPKPDAQTVVDTAPESETTAVTTNDGTTASLENTVNLQTLGLITNPDISSNFRASTNGLSILSNNQVSASVNAASQMLNVSASKLSDYSVKTDYSLISALTPKALTNAAAAGSGALGNAQATINQALNPTNAVDQAFKMAASQLSGLVGFDSKISQVLTNIFSIVPDVKVASQQMKVNNLDQAQLAKLPAFNPSYGLRDSGFTGVNPVNNLSAQTDGANPLANINPQLIVDQVTNIDTVNSGLGLLPGGSNFSTEGRQIAINDSLGVSSRQVDTSVVSDNNYGSKTKDNISPLLSAMNNA